MQTLTFVTGISVKESHAVQLRALPPIAYHTLWAWPVERKPNLDLQYAAVSRSTS